MDSLQKILLEFAASENYDPIVRDNKIEISIPYNESKVTIHMVYTFNGSGSYEFGATLGEVPPLEKDLGAFSIAILRSPPITGLTERVINGKFSVLGAREGVEDNKAAATYQKDVERVLSAYDRYGPILLKSMHVMFF